MTHTIKTLKQRGIVAASENCDVTRHVGCLMREYLHELTADEDVVKDFRIHSYSFNKNVDRTQHITSLRKS